MKMALILLALCLLWPSTAFAQEPLQGRVEVTFSTVAEEATLVFNSPRLANGYARWFVNGEMVEEGGFLELYRRLGGRKSYEKLSNLAFINLAAQEGWHLKEFYSKENESIFKLYYDPKAKYEYAQLFYWDHDFFYFFDTDKKSYLAKDIQSLYTKVNGGFSFGPKTMEHFKSLIRRKGWEDVTNGLMKSHNSYSLVYYYRRKGD